MAKTQNRKKSSRKAGRNLEKCKRYKAQGRREINKAKKLRRHLKCHPNDQVARRTLG